MPNLKDIGQGVTHLFNRPAQPVQAGPIMAQQAQGGPPMPQAGMQAQGVPQSYPPAPALKRQQKPTEMSMSDLKYNAFNVDEIKVQITNRRGFDGVTPDLVIWNQYQYNVTAIKANADESELSGYVAWALKDKGIQDAKIDFHPNQRVTVSGKYPLLGIPLPFTAEVQLSLTPEKQILMTVDEFKTGFSFPNKLRDTLLDLLVDDAPASQGPPPASPIDAFSFASALRKAGPNQILVDFGRMPVPMRVPITSLKTSEQGVEIEGSGQ